MPLLSPRIRSYFTRSAVFVALIVAGVLAYRAYGGPGLLLAAGGAVMWALLHMSRVLAVLRRTAQRPVGVTDSAVMLHARLASGMTLLQVLALSRSLGQRIGPESAAVEQYLWTDGSQACVQCRFEHGKLAAWELVRP